MMGFILVIFTPTKNIYSLLIILAVHIKTETNLTFQHVSIVNKMELRIDLLQILFLHILAQIKDHICESFSFFKDLNI